MKDYLKKNGIRMGIIVAAVVLIISLSSAARGGQISLFHNVSGVLLSPVQKVVSSAVNWFDTIYGYLYEYDSLMAENESLRTQLAEAQQSARDGIEASEENQRLRELLNLREKHTDYEFESCKVVLWSSSNWSHSFTISKGAGSGIELGDPDRRREPDRDGRPHGRRPHRHPRAGRRQGGGRHHEALQRVVSYHNNFSLVNNF